MTAIFDTLLVKLEEHRQNPTSAQIVREFHDLAAGALPHIEQVLDHVVPLRPLLHATGGGEAKAASPLIVEGDTSGLPPALTPPATNWGTNQRLDGAAEVRKPAADDAARGVLALALARKIKAKPIGTAHSSSSVFATSGILIDSGVLVEPSTTAATSALRRCRELEPGLYRLADAERAMHIEFGSGTQVKDVNAYLAASHRALRMTGAYTGQTLVGAFCTSTHGGGIQHPPLHAAVRSIQLLTVDKHGAVVELRIEPSHGITDPEAYARAHPGVQLIQSDDWFGAVVVAMGCMGFITSVIIEATTPFSLRREDWKGSFEACREILRDTDASGYPRYFAGAHHGSVSFNPYAVPLCAQGRQTAVMGRSFVESTPPAEYHAPSQSNLSPLLVAAGRDVGNYLAALAPFIIDLALGGDPSKPTWGPSYQVLGNPDNLPAGFSAEYAFPLSRYMEGIEAILARMAELAEKEMKYMIGGITLRWVGKDSAFLSMSEGDDRVYAEFLSLAHAGHGQEVLAAIEPIALAHGGRPHWGQWFSHEAMPKIVEMYPRYGQWKEIYQQLNVSGLFSNEFTERLP